MPSMTETALKLFDACESGKGLGGLPRVLP